MTRVADGQAVTTLPARVARAVGRVGERDHLRLIGRGLPDPLVAGYIIASGVWISLLLTGYVALSGTDAYAYWALEVSDSGPATVGGTAFLYSPAAAQALAPLALLPWPMFAALYASAMLACLYAVSGRWAALLLLAPPVAVELYVGNIHLPLAAVAIFGLRWPGLWAFALLTKVTPGVGVVWFLFRREWRALWIALGVTAAIVAVSFALAPEAWAAWAGVLSTAQPEIGYPHVPVPLVWRLPFALALVAWGAWTDRRWTVPVGMLLALPVIWPGSFALLVALQLRQGRPEGDRQPAGIAPAAAFGDGDGDRAQ